MDKYNDPTGFRMERVQKLLHELRYEITRGMMDGELPDEEMHYRFYVPVSKAIPNGVVACRFETRPIPHHMIDPRDGMEPRLKIVGKD